MSTENRLEKNSMINTDGTQPIANLVSRPNERKQNSQKINQRNQNQPQWNNQWQNNKGGRGNEMAMVIMAEERSSGTIRNYSVKSAINSDIQP